jgi:hypothetical protein
MGRTLVDPIIHNKRHKIEMAIPALKKIFLSDKVILEVYP